MKVRRGVAIVFFCVSRSLVFGLLLSLTHFLVFPPTLSDSRFLLLVFLGDMRSWKKEGEGCEPTAPLLLSLFALPSLPFLPFFVGSLFVCILVVVEIIQCPE